MGRLVRLKWAALLALLLLAAGCTGGGAGGGGGSGGGGPLPDEHTAIETFVHKYAKHAKEQETEEMALMYTEPAQWTEGPAGTQELSRAEIKAMLDATYLIATTIYASEARDLKITVSGDSATVEFTWFQDVWNAVLGQRATSQGEITWLLERVAGVWYIAHSKMGPVSTE